MKAFLVLIMAWVIAILNPLGCALLLMGAGLVVQYNLPDTYAAFCSYFGWPFEAWQTGALIGFASGMLSSFGLKLKGG